ncbi:MAG: hypothetical protein LBS36_12640 [Oscillospiraceae bacterium]|jgi:hypothetical protein|nr:hypothetical protein [Oscillospiraceae bacterium]
MGSSNNFFSRLNAMFISFLLFISNLLFPGSDWIADRINDASFFVDTANAGAIMGNKVSNFNAWSSLSVPAETAYVNANPMQFVEYIQLMQCTGGSEERDLFQDPLDRTVLDDYDFSSLITACRNVLALGAKPHIKTGNVPLKLTTNPKIGVFGVNVYPPDDYNQYYTYIAAIAAALVQEFGLAEVQTWRFGVLTEFENSDWFMARSGNPQESFVAYCKLYDYTLAALQSVVGPEVIIGAHAMAVSEGLWDEGKFIEHCATGTNWVTGETGSRICFLTASYYDSSPTKLRDNNVADVVNALRAKAESAGLSGLLYGVDEGRIYGSAKGGVDSQLLRIVGQTYQASYDARMLRLQVENGIDYFSSWGYTSDAMFGGYPSVAYHVAEQYANVLSGKNHLPHTLTKQHKIPGAEVDLVAGIDETTRTVGVMVYNFKPAWNYTIAADLRVDIKLPAGSGDTVIVTCRIVDDNANFFDEWEADRKANNIGADAFAWSCDDPAVESFTTLQAPWARDFYFENLRDSYIEASRLVSETTAYAVTNGQITLATKLPPYAAVFYEISY